MIVNENAKLKHFRQALVMRLLFAFHSCRKNLPRTRLAVSLAQPIPAWRRMNIISTKKAISFLPSNTTSAGDTAVKANAATAPTATKTCPQPGNFLCFGACPPPPAAVSVRLSAASPRLRRLSLPKPGLSASILHADWEIISKALNRIMH